jgi:hypothetical protein
MSFKSLRLPLAATITLLLAAQAFALNPQPLPPRAPPPPSHDLAK